MNVPKIYQFTKYHVPMWREKERIVIRRTLITEMEVQQ